MTMLAPETYPHSLWSNFYRFLSVRLENVSVEFWRLFRARAPPYYAKLEIGPGWFCFDTRNIPTLFGTHFLSFLIRTGKTGLRQIFTTYSGPAQPVQQKFKTGPHDSV